MTAENKSNTPLGQTLNLRELINYQDSAVVSRTIIDKKAGTITVFAFDAGEGLSEHTAPYDAFVEVVEGEAEIVIDGNVHRVGTGEVIIMPAQKPHSVRALDKFKMVLIMIRA